MSQFYIVNESSEDTLGTSDNLQDAVRLAREASKQGHVGDPVSIIDSDGKAIRQFLLLGDGAVAEQAIAGHANRSI